MGLAQAVSLPRGGGTLKGQRPLTATSGPLRSTPTLTPPLSGPLDLFPKGDQQPQPSSGKEGARRLARRWRGPRGAGHVPREPAGQEVRLRAGLGRLGRAGLCARSAAG